MAALNTAEVQQLQNREPTNWDVLDQGLQDMSSFNVGRFAMDDRLHVQFLVRPHLNMTKSEEAKRAIYEDREYIRIMIPGDKLNIIERIADSLDIGRFRELYKKFKLGQEQVTGTPLSAVPFLTMSQVEEYKYVNVRTVEQLANLADSWTGTIMGGVTHKQKAKDWLEALNGVDSLRTEFGVKEKALQEQILKMQAQLDAMQPTKVTKAA